MVKLPNATNRTKLPMAPKAGKVPTGKGGMAMLKTTKGMGPDKMKAAPMMKKGNMGSKTGGGAVPASVKKEASSGRMKGSGRGGR